MTNAFRLVLKYFRYGSTKRVGLVRITGVFPLNRHVCCLIGVFPAKTLTFYSLFSTFFSTFLGKARAAQVIKTV
jgi:hypothetical protein